MLPHWLRRVIDAICIIVAVSMLLDAGRTWDQGLPGTAVTRGFTALLLFAAITINLWTKD